MIFFTRVDGDVKEFGYQHLRLAVGVVQLDRFDEEERAAVSIGQPLDVDEDFVTQIMQIQLVGDVLNKCQEDIDSFLIDHVEFINRKTQ